MHAVTGHANFQMDNTALTVGEFTQPAVARNIIEQHAGSELASASVFFGYSLSLHSQNFLV